METNLYLQWCVETVHRVRQGAQRARGDDGRQLLATDLSSARTQVIVADEMPVDGPRLGHRGGRRRIGPGLKLRGREGQGRAGRGWRRRLLDGGTIVMHLAIVWTGMERRSGAVGRARATRVPALLREQPTRSWGAASVPALPATGSASLAVSMRSAGSSWGCAPRPAAAACARAAGRTLVQASGQRTRGGSGREAELEPLPLPSGPQGDAGRPARRPTEHSAADARACSSWLGRRRLTREATWGVRESWLQPTDASVRRRTAPHTDRPRWESARGAGLGDGGAGKPKPVEFGCPCSEARRGEAGPGSAARVRRAGGRGRCRRGRSGC